MADDGGGVGKVGGMMSEKSGIVRTVGEGDDEVCVSCVMGRIE